MHSDGQTDQRNSRRRVRGREPRSDNDAWASYQRQQNFGRVSSVQATPVASPTWEDHLVRDRFFHLFRH